MSDIRFRILAYGALALAAGCAAPAGPAASAQPTVAADDPPRPTCAVAMTAPLAIDGQQLFDSGPLDDCSESDWEGVMELRFLDRGLQVLLDIDRAQATPGNTIDLPSPAARLQTRGYADCGGVLTWQSDEPDWALAVDAQCDDGSSLVARWWGHHYVGND